MHICLLQENETSPARPGVMPGCLFLSYIFSKKFGTPATVFPWSERVVPPLKAEWYTARGMLVISCFTSDVANSSNAWWSAMQWSERKGNVRSWWLRDKTNHRKPRMTPVLLSHFTVEQQSKSNIVAWEGGTSISWGFFPWVSIKFKTALLKIKGTC